MFGTPGRISAAMLAGAVSLGALGAAQAANDAKGDWPKLDSWSQEKLYKGWSADEMMDEEVYGANGDVIGEVEDFLIGPDGKIARVVVEGGGFLDIGDSHLALPWNKMKRRGSDAFVTSAVNEENFGEMGLFDNVDDTSPKPKYWRLSNLTGDLVSLEGNVGYGSVDDVIFSENGKIQAVVTRPSAGYGYGAGARAMPFAHAQFDPYQPYYRTPYRLSEVEKTDRFNYGRLDGQSWEGEAFGEE